LNKITIIKLLVTLNNPPALRAADATLNIPPIPERQIPNDFKPSGAARLGLPDFKSILNHCDLIGVTTFFVPRIGIKYK
jgi:hypothetical protein